MKSNNFEMLRNRWPELASLGGFAEAYALHDPAGALVKLRLFAENLTKDIYRDLGLPKPDQSTLIDLLQNSSFRAITPKVVLNKLHALRIHGNKAAHGDQAFSQTVIWLLREAYDLARWLFIQYDNGSSVSISSFMTSDSSRRKKLKMLGRISTGIVSAMCWTSRLNMRSTTT